MNRSDELRSNRRSFLGVAAVLMGVMLASCGGGGDAAPATETGDSGRLLFSLAMSPESAVRLQRREAVLDCDTFDIAFIEAVVFDPFGAVIAAGGPWPCEDRRGTIEAVPVGGGRTVVVEAIGADGRVLFSGAAEEVTVRPNQITDAGTILLLPAVNLPPALAPVGNQVVPAGLPIALFLEASDPNAEDGLTFGAGDLPPGAFFDPETGRFEWTPSLGREGNFPVTFSVTDTGAPPLADAETITITVGPGNQPPVIEPIEDQDAATGSIVAFAVVATDPDPEDAVTLSVQGGPPAGARFDPATGRFQWEIAESDIGVRDVTFVAVDSGAPPLSDAETVRFFIEPGNAPPVFTPLGNQRVDEGEELVFVVVATDPDGDSLTYTHGDLPEGAGFDPDSQTFFWTPGFEAAGNYSVEFTATDSGEPPLSATLVVPIAVGGVNRPPRFEPVDPLEAVVGEPVEWVLSATDPDGDTLTFAAEDLPEGAEFDPAAPRFQWTPSEFSEEPVFVLFTVADDGAPNLTDLLEVEITLVSDNRPPVLRPIGNRSVSVGGGTGAFLSFPMQAADPDGDTLTFSGAGAPFQRGAFLSPANDPDEQIFNWNVSNQDIGTHSTTFTVTDDGSPPASDAETIFISVASANQPPALSPIGDQTIVLDVEFFTGALDLSVTASDPDPNDALTLTASGQPLALGAQFSSEGGSGFFSWSVTSEEVGTYGMTFSVADNGVPARSDSETITIQVVLP